MNPTELRRLAEQLFSRRPDARTNVKEYEARSREVQRKIEHLRQLRLAQAQRVSDISTTGTQRILTAGVAGRRLNARAEN